LLLKFGEWKAGFIMGLRHNKKEIENISKRMLLKMMLTLKKYGVKKAGIFGSYARGEQNKDSDLDVLVEISDKKTLLFLAELKVILSNLLHRNVDLVEYDYVHPLIKEDVLKQEIRLYG
jgi:predicted nucleotidyltransferase